MKKTLIKMGNVVAILLMFSPIVIASLNTKIDKYWWLFLILSICYDFYMYSLIQFNEKMEENKNIFNNVAKGKVIESDSEEKKLRWYYIICINILNDYFKDDFTK